MRPRAAWRARLLAALWLPCTHDRVARREPGRIEPMSGFLANMAFYILPFIVVVGVVITVHEFGHFLAAKALGTKIDQFSIGFGKPLARWVDKSGVEWRLGWLPIGGFVRFAGDDNAASVPDQHDLEDMRRDLVAREGETALGQYYHFKPIWQRALISAA